MSNDAFDTYAAGLRAEMAEFKRERREDITDPKPGRRVRAVLARVADEGMKHVPVWLGVQLKRALSDYNFHHNRLFEQLEQRAAEEGIPLDALLIREGAREAKVPEHEFVHMALYLEYCRHKLGDLDRGRQLLVDVNRRRTGHANCDEVKSLLESLCDPTILFLAKLVRRATGHTCSRATIRKAIHASPVLSNKWGQKLRSTRAKAPLPGRDDSPARRAEAYELLRRAIIEHYPHDKAAVDRMTDRQLHHAISALPTKAQEEIYSKLALPSHAGQ